MSPGLLSKRLREMEANGLVSRQRNGHGGHAEYLTTPLADELEPLIRGLGEWAHRNIDCDVSLQHLDARMLMWNIRRKIDMLQLPKRKCVVQFLINDPPKEPADYWLVAKPGEEPDLCYTDPKFEMDLFVVCELRALTSAWMGHSTFAKEKEAGRISLVGHEMMARTLTKWLRRSSFADVAQPRENPPPGQHTTSLVSS